MKVVTTEGLRTLIQRVGFQQFNHLLLNSLKEDFRHWEGFRKSPRHVMHYPEGVIELMPCADEHLYGFKYVNGHPKNTNIGKLSVIAFGVLAEVSTGYPLMLCEMTLATALRTAATAALGAHYLARADSRRVAIIGCGAQSEFMVLAVQSVLPIGRVDFYDIDRAAMVKFARNLEGAAVELRPAAGISEAIRHADIIITATAAKRRNRLFPAADVGEGVHIHGNGGDCQGKTELDPLLLERAKIVVEYAEQSRIEGEIQNRPEVPIHAELWEIVSGRKPGRENAQELTLFDSVGFALEDFSILRLIHRLSDELKIGEEVDLIPSLADPKDLYGFLRSP